MQTCHFKISYTDSHVAKNVFLRAQPSLLFTGARLQQMIECLCGLRGVVITVDHTQLHARSPLSLSGKDLSGHKPNQRAKETIPTCSASLAQCSVPVSL